MFIINDYSVTFYNTNIVFFVFLKECFRLFRSYHEFEYKSSPKEKNPEVENLTVFNRKSNFLLNTVDFFSTAVFSRGELLYANSC
jgi:hypothetical protein